MDHGLHHVKVQPAVIIINNKQLNYIENHFINDKKKILPAQLYDIPEVFYIAVHLYYDSANRIHYYFVRSMKYSSPAHLTLNWPHCKFFNKINLL